MIFAEIEYEGHYSEFHPDLLAFVQKNFSPVQSGHQGDSWIWIGEGEEKVAIDTFTSMKHQIKASASGSLVKNVIDILARRYKVKVHERPEPEAHED